MSGDADILNPDPQTPPPVADAAPPLNPPVETPKKDTDDEPEVLEIPTGEKLVPLSALESARAKAKAVREELDGLKGEVGKSAEKDAQIAQLQQQLQHLGPKAQAYDAALEAQRNQPPPPQAPTPAQTAKLEKIARSLDYYKTDSTLDLERAQTHLDLLREEAAEIAREQVEPYRQQTVSQQSFHMLQRALVTPSEDGMMPDPEVLKAVWGKLDPAVTGTLEGARVAYALAKGVRSVPAPKKAKEVIPEPLESEKAGGKDVAAVTLRDSDKRIARDLGMSDKEYAAEVAQMPAGWGKGQ